MKLLVGYDGSNSAKDALALAVKHAKAFNASVDIVTSMETGTVEQSGDIQQAKNDLDAAEKSVRSQGIAIESHLLIRGMKPGEDLVQFARESGAGNIFIGVKRRSKVGKLLFGSNAQYIILKAPCPVTTVR
jgi:nucleotide-binding universal stress UspA family protein